MKLIAGTRGSELAKRQTALVITELKLKYPAIDIETKIIKTKGDKILNSPLSKIKGKGLFTKELEMALLSGEIDFAVHSLKDLPVDLPQGLDCSVYLKRDKPNDVLISKNGKTLKDIPKNGQIATGSLRRALQLKRIRPDIKTIDIRGNINTRLEKFKNSDWDGIVFAYAGLARLDMESEISQILPFEIMLPAVAQGIIAVEVRTSSKASEYLKELTHLETSILGRAERTFLSAMGGGCQIPLACSSSLLKDTLTLTGLYMPDNGNFFISELISGNKENPEGLGKLLAQKILTKYKELKK